MPKAKNLLYLRKKACLTQEKLADELGVTIATIRSWEHKKTAIPVPATHRIASYFGVSFSEFCDTDLELLDSDLSGEELQLTAREAQNIRLFRKLPDEVKDMIRYILIATYDHSQKGEEN